VRTQNTAEAAILELLKQPTTQERVQGSRTSIIPGVVLRSIVLNEDGLATVDFSRDLVFGLGGSCNVQALQSQIRQTLLQFSSVKDVKILIEGEDAEMTIQP
jgi:spore germination protein GerM